MALLPIEFHPEAIAEAHEAYEWYAKRSEAAAEKFMDELDVATDAIQHSPELAVTF